MSVTQINLLPDVPPMGSRLIAINNASVDRRVRSELLAHAPEWARWWTQDASGAGLYWDHQPVADLLFGCWVAAPNCQRNYRALRRDMPLAGAWQDILIELLPEVTRD